MRKKTTVAVNRFEGPWSNGNHQTGGLHDVNFRPAIIFLSAFTICITFQSRIFGQDTLRTGEPAPTFYLKTVDHTDFFLTDYCGKPRQPWKKMPRKPVVMSFFATWCVPCREEIPVLEEMAGQYGDRVSFVLVDLQEKKPLVEKFVREHKIKLPVLLDRFGVTAKKYKVEVLPSLFAVDPQGQLVFVRYGYKAGFGPKLRAAIDKSLGPAGN